MTPGGARAQRQVWGTANSSILAGAPSPRKKVRTRGLGLSLRALGAPAEAVGLPLQAVLSHGKVFSKEKKKMGLTRLEVMKISPSQVAARLTRVLV